MVLIDTAGMSQRDRMLADQAAMLTQSSQVNRLLLLNAGSRGDTLDDVVRAYGGDSLAGCILTKVDEATALAPSIELHRAAWIDIELCCQWPARSGRPLFT
jgi:flagellar biosynthesis protein FlhF